MYYLVIYETENHDYIEAKVLEKRPADKNEPLQIVSVRNVQFKEPRKSVESVSVSKQVDQVLVAKATDLASNSVAKQIQTPSK